MPSSSVRPLVLLGAALCLVFADVAQGFEAWEHKRISNAAVAIARLEAEEDGTLPALSVQTQDLMRQLGSGAEGMPSYGYFVGLVDYVSRPEDLFAKQGHLPAYERELLDWPEITRVRASVLDYLFATKYDEMHFGNEALFNADHFHDEAITLAIRKGSWLLEALLLNAFSDHFRQDFMAPGHVVAPKGLAHDAIVKAIHDHYNRKGLDFFLKENEAMLQRLSDLASYLDRPEVQAALQCPAVSAVQANAMLKGRVLGEMRGDGQLWPSPSARCNGGRIDQISLLVLVTAGSIRDVLQAFRTGQLPESLGARFWGQNGGGIGGEDGNPRGMSPMERTAATSEVRKGLPGNCPQRGDTDIFAGCTAEGCYCFPSRILKEPFFAPFVAPGFSTVALSSNGVYETRLRLQLDALALFLPPLLVERDPDEQRFLRLPGQFLLGGVYEWNGRTRAYGARVATVSPIGRLPLQLVSSSELKLVEPLFYVDGIRESARLRFGYHVGLEAGFGFFFIRVGATRDYRIAQDGKPEVAWGIASTLSMQLPASMF